LPLGYRHSIRDGFHGVPILERHHVRMMIEQHMIVRQVIALGQMADGAPEAKEGLRR
jgi:hypothetical protein